MAIWCLKELLTLWLSQSKLTFQLIQEDIEQLHVDVQVSMLCKSYPIELFDHIILPLISPASAAPTALHKHCFIVIADKVLRVGSVPFMSYFNGLIVSRLLDGSYLQLNQVSTVVQRIRDWKVPTSFKIPSKYLVDDVNLMLYHMLLSDFVSQKELLALLRGDWHTLLQSTAALLKLEITKLTGDDSKGNEAAIPSRHRGAGQDKSSASTKASQSSNQESIKSIMVASAFHQVLLPLVWGLGSSDETLAIRSKKGIQLICTCYHQKQWKLQEGNDRTLHALVEASASTIISTSFLFIISYLLQHQWKHQSNTQQIQSLTALQELIVTFFQPTDLIKFLPKIFNFVDTAFTNTCQQVRYKAVQIMVSICYMIPVDTIELHLCSIITGLYPIIEDKPVSGIVLQIGLDHATTTGNEMESYASQFAASLPTPNNKDNITQPLLSLQGIVQQAKDQLFYQSRAKQEAISLIRSLFIDAKYQSLASKLPLLPGIPDVDELKGVQHLHQQAIASLTFQQKLENMASLFTHETAQVRLIALRASRQILTEYKDDIYQVIADSMINPASSSHYEHSIAFIMKELLSLCSRETIYEVKLACAKCLGELGAIDPAFLRLPSLRSLQHSKNGTEDEFQYPWQMTLPQFGMIILRSYIVIGLKAASSSSVQDQSGFAIQMLLHLLHHHLKQQHHTQGLQPLVSTKSTRKKKDDAHEETSMVGQDQQMSPELRDSLNKSNIFDICEPFWFSKYHMNDPNSIRQPPIFTHGLSFSRWIGLLCRYLVSIASSPLQGIFHAVRGVVRNRIDLCQFLLPFLLLDVACYGSSEQLHGILHEFSAVLQDAKASDGNNQAIAHVDPSNTMAATSSVAIVSNPTVAGTTTALNLNQLCVQAVFRVLDTFTDWLSAINANKQQQDQQQKDNSTASASSSSTASSKDVFAHEQQIKEAINRVFDTLSLKLLCDAALSIKAYARAMRYFEIYTRQQHRVLRHIPAEERFAQQQGSESNAQSLSKKPNDRAGGELPILSQDQLDALATMYAAVEDTDALEGVQLVRRMYGHDESYRHRILELVQSDDWLGALLEYELLQNSQVYHNSLQIHLSDGSASKTGIADPTGTALSRAPSHRSNTTVTTDVSANTSTATSKLMSFEEINEVEKGKLQCLIELGHLESAIYHVSLAIFLDDLLQILIAR